MATSKLIDKGGPVCTVSMYGIAHGQGVMNISSMALLGVIVGWCHWSRASAFLPIGFWSLIIIMILVQ